MGRKMKLRSMLLLLALAGAAVPEAWAQIITAQFMGQPGVPDYVPPPPWSGPGEWIEDPAPPPPQRVCKKLCANDFSPCDPLYFKTEDGRCDGLDLGR